MTGNDAVDALLVFGGLAGVLAVFAVWWGWSVSRQRRDD